MTGSVAVNLVSVFTREPGGGNQAGVVLGADGLSDGQMQYVASQVNLSETAFVFESTPAEVVSVRFFTPIQEVPVCGHATLAAHYVRAVAQGRTSGEAIQTSPGASWTVRWELRNGARSVFMRQGPVEYGDVLEAGIRARLVGALGVADDAIVPDSPTQVISTGHAKVIVPVRSLDVLALIAPNLDALRSLSGEIDVGGYFLFAPDHRDRDTFTVCRMFGPAIGVDEDPVNGSGHGPLAAYLLQRDGEAAAVAKRGFWSRMGDNLGRPGRVWVQAAEDGRTVEVGGSVTPAASSEIELPGTP